MPSLDRNSTVPYYQQVYDQISKGIEKGFYPAGKKLPSIRECARELGVSNTTIELAYQKLVDEGYIQAKRGSGYTICALSKAPQSELSRFTEEYLEGCARLVESDAELESLVVPAYDFAYDSVDASLFPLTAWARISREVFFDTGAEAACLYNDRQGLKELRSQIAQYLNGEYGLDCSLDQVLVMPTTRDLVSEVTALFEPSSTVVAMEEPGYDEVALRLEERGYEVRLVPVHPYPTWEDVESLLDDVNIAFVTPASQFPTNTEMSLGLREKLVSWAQDNDVYVIDDEYGWEFYTGMARIPSLAMLDNAGHVVTIGTFSNSFTPAVSLSYAVLPPQLMLKWRSTRRNAHSQVPWQTQAAMAAFMRDGHWRTHVRKIRTAMRKKRAALTNALNTYMGDAVEVVENMHSLFVIAKTRDGRTESELIEAAAQAGVRVYPTSRYWSGDVPKDWNYIQIGFAGIPLGDIDKGIEVLARAWGFLG